MTRLTPIRPVFRLMWRAHRLVWDLSGGRIGGRVAKMPVLQLVTTGHKSGEQRSVLLNYLPTPGGPALAGSNAGADWDPAWARNLKATPVAEVREKGEWRRVRGRLVEGDDYETLYAQFVELQPAYGDYRAMTDRVIPLLVLETSE